MSEFIHAMAESIRTRSLFPAMPVDLDLETAYRLQRSLVAEVAGSKLAGLKAGMTAAAGQQAFGLTHPLIGSLYAEGKLESGTTFASGPGVSLECEIGVIVDGDGEPQTAGPVIEVPRAAWSDPGDAKGANLTATNIAADRFIVGEQQALRDDYDRLSVQLTRDGEIVCDAPLSDALGGPLLSLAWMREEAAKRDLQITDGMLLITGACGGIHPAEPGAYVADYGVLGRVEFSVT